MLLPHEVNEAVQKLLAGREVAGFVSFELGQEERDLLLDQLGHVGFKPFLKEGRRCCLYAHVLFHSNALNYK